MPINQKFTKLDCLKTNFCLEKTKNDTKVKSAVAKTFFVYSNEVNTFCRNGSICVEKYKFNKIECRKNKINVKMRKVDKNCQNSLNFSTKIRILIFFETKNTTDSVRFGNAPQGIVCNFLSHLVLTIACKNAIIIAYNNLSHIREDTRVLRRRL